MPLDCAFRTAEVSESEEIASFIERVIATSVDAAKEEKLAFVANVRKNLALWSAEPERSVHLAAWDGTELVGVVLVREFWNLCNLFVAAEYQSKGLGRQLIERALATCAGRSPSGRVRLNASRNAVGFYQHMGFSVRAGALVAASTPMEIHVNDA